MIVSYKNESWTVLRRFSSFAEFHNVASRIVGKSNLPPFPKKKLGKADPTFLESRRLQLLSHMTNIVKIPRIAQSRALDSFILISKHKNSLIETTEPSGEENQSTNNPSPYELFRKSSPSITNSSSGM